MRRSILISAIAGVCLMLFLVAYQAGARAEGRQRTPSVLRPKQQSTLTDTAYLPLVLNQRPLELMGGAPISVAGRHRATQATRWELPPSGRLIADGSAAEPFRLDPSLDINAVDYSTDDSDTTLLAATDQGVYRRNPTTYRWRQISEEPARRVASLLNDDLWIVPTSAPEQLWYSQDWGNTWEQRDEGLEGTIVSRPYLALPGLQMYVLTERDQQYVLWNRPYEDADHWTEIATVPGVALPPISSGTYGSLMAASHNIGVEVWAGSTDGTLYRLNTYDACDTGHEGTWEPLWTFAAGVYPLMLADDMLTLIDLESGAMQFYRLVYEPADELFCTAEWEPAAFPAPDLPWGAHVLPNDEAVQRMVAPGFALTTDGVLYAQVPSDTAGLVWRSVTVEPERTTFIANGDEPAESRPLYSGAHLRWDGATCTAEEMTFYRSDNLGTSWTVVVSDTARMPVHSPSSDADLVLAATCGGPTISSDGGVTWATPAELGWPEVVGAQYLAVHTELDGGEVWRTIYAAGMRASGETFLYRATYDAETNTVGAWTEITPTGLSAPTALLATGATGGPTDLYVADEATVWLSADDGASWDARDAGLGDATVHAIAALKPFEEGTGVFLATDHGLMFGPPADESGTWTATDLPYTTEPADFQRPAFDGSIFLNGRTHTYELREEFFHVRSGPQPTLTPTPTPTATATPTSSPSATPTSTPTTPGPPTETPSTTPTPTATVGPTFTPSSTPTPTATPTSTPTLAATYTPSPTPEPTSTPQPTPTSPPTATATPAPTCDQLLVNGGFENDEGWALPSTTYPSDYSTTRAFAGTRSLRVGIPAGGTNIYSFSSGYQWVDLPADAATITLRTQVWRGSTTTSADGDTQYLWIRTSDDTVHKVFHGYSNARVWQSVEYDLTWLKGERVQIYFGAYNNGVGGTTVMYADEAAVEYCDS